MSKQEKEKHCWTCGKRLIDERLPICSRCGMKIGNRVAVAVAGSLVAVGFKVKGKKNSL